MKVRPDFDGVGSEDFGKTVTRLKCVVDLFQLVGICADGEVIEIDALDAFGFG